MQLETFAYTRAGGWSVDPLPALDSDRTLVIVFGAASFADEPTPLAQLRAAYPHSHVLGCSTSGEILERTLNDESLSVAVARFDESALAIATAEVAQAGDSFDAGRLLAERLTREDLKAILVLSDGLQVNGTSLVQGLGSALPDGVVVTGGLAGDGDRFKRTWVMNGGVPASGMVSAVGLYGDRIEVGHGSKGGWDIFGPERVVTRSCGNVLHELDGKPALALYKEYLGERAAGLPATALLFPLALRRDRDDPDVVVRTVLAVDEAAQSMTFAGDIPEGHLAQLMRANFERLIDGAALAAAQTVEAMHGSAAATLSIAISCVGRRLILGQRAEEEIEAALGEMPSGTRQVGFYSYGELSPRASGRCDLHNQTMTLTTIRER